MSEENCRGPGEPQDSCQVLERDHQKVISFEDNKQGLDENSNVKYLTGLTGKLTHPIAHTGKIFYKQARYDT